MISLVPAFGTLYQCLTPLESTRFLSAQKLKRHEHTNEAQLPLLKCRWKRRLISAVCFVYLHQNLEFSFPCALEFIAYFSEWRHGKMLLGTCACWFLLDITWVQPCLLLFDHLLDWFAIGCMWLTWIRMPSSNRSDRMGTKVPLGIDLSRSRRVGWLLPP